MSITVDELLKKTVERDGSDLHLKADSRPLIRIYGELMPVAEVDPMEHELVRKLAYSIMSESQRERFDKEWELDMAYVIEGVARFRVNAFIQRGNVGLVFRVIPIRIQTMEELDLPAVCKYFAERPRGLVLVTGPAGSGKSTTQAAMIDYINKREPCHIVTVEDPVEFLHEDVQALINQRELDTDTLSFANALKYVLRQDPDVILVGEMRDLETIQLAITAAETGHLVFATLHTPDAVQTIDRVIDVFPMYQQAQVRMQLAVNLIGVTSQTLVRRVGGKGRVAAFETLVAVSSIRNMIRESKTFQISSMIQTGARQGMMTLDQYLAQLVKAGKVTREDAYQKASNHREFEALLESSQPRK
ncbi:MAG: type IV pilus twitching motility protein PilT [Armatimonadetes bacterium]|nr:type IV pilus twitching motility protein PilT [Armatimonadota bacterium]